MSGDKDSQKYSHTAEPAVDPLTAELQAILDSTPFASYMPRKVLPDNHGVEPYIPAGRRDVDDASDEVEVEQVETVGERDDKPKEGADKDSVGEGGSEEGTGKV
ncbi:hypothetical protein JCM8208_003146 [Rhodotorula glutinis]